MTTSTARKIAENIFDLAKFKTNQSTKVELSYYSLKAQQTVLLSTCKSAVSSLINSVEWLYNNKQIDSILITGWRVTKQPWGGKDERFDFVEEIKREDLAKHFEPIKVDGILFKSLSEVESYTKNKQYSKTF